MKRALVGISVVLAGAGCPADPEPLFPADYATTFNEVRDCRNSADHELSPIRVLANATAEGPYVDRDGPFPVGAMLIKEEFDFADTDCAGAIKQWTVMVKLADGSSPDTIDWDWQKVRADRSVSSENEPRCIGCHVDCDFGYLGTCAAP